MKILLLTRNKDLYSSRRVLEAAKQRGHSIEAVDYMDCSMTIASRRPSLIYRGEQIGDVDAVIPRIGASQGFYGTAVVRQFEMQRVFCANSSLSITRARDKLRSLQILARNGIAMPVTGFAGSHLDSKALIKMVGGAPLIIKLIEGTQGVGVVLAETSKAAESVIDAFRGLKTNVLVQEYIAESEGEDIRAFVVEGKVFASMRRKAAAGEFRSNIHRGGSGEKIKLSPDERAIAVAAAKAMGLNIAGVDMIRSNHGSLVIEVNSSPGLEGIEGATGKDVAGRIIEFVEKAAEKGPKTDRVGH